MLLTTFIDHLVFRVAELDRTERFYTALLGEPVERTEESLMYISGKTRLFFTLAAESARKPHDKEAVGLNHLAFGVRTLEELRKVQAHLDEQDLIHSGILLDPYGLKDFIWLDDPDGMRVEFYLRPPEVLEPHRQV